MSEIDNISVENAWVLIRFIGVLATAGIVLDIILALKFRKEGFKWHRFDVYLRSRPWTLRDAGVITAVLLCAWSIAQILTLSAESRGWRLDDMPSYVVLVLTFLFFHVPGLIALCVLAQRRAISGKEGFGLEKSGLLRNVTYGAIFCVAVLPVIWSVTVLYNYFLLLVGIPPDTQPIVNILMDTAGRPWWVQALLLITAIALVPAIEELLFRGVGLPFLAKRFGAGPGIIMTSLVFAVLHAHVPSYAPLFVLSVAFCLAYGYSGSILLPVVMHSLFNFVSIAILTLYSLQSA